VVGIVVVSHSRPLARAAVTLATQMVDGQDIAIAVAAGLDEVTLGTDAVAVADAIVEVDGPDGVVVLVDLGSAVLSADLALDLLPDGVRDRVILSAAPLVEGLVAAVVTAAGGASAAEVAAEAMGALADKRAHLGVESPVAGLPVAGPVPAATTTPEQSTEPVERAEVRIEPAHGLHARPAAKIVGAVRGLDAAVTLGRPGAPAVPARSLSRLTALGVRSGETVEIVARGPDAAAAVAALVDLAGRSFDEQAGPEIRTARTVPVPALAPGRVGGTAVTVLAGLALGPAFGLRPLAPVVPATELGTPEQRRERLLAAVAAVRADLDDAAALARSRSGDRDAAIFEAHLLLLEDPDLLDTALAAVAGGAGPARAWADAVATAEARFAELDDEYLRARAADVRAVGDEVLAALVGSARSAVQLPPAHPGPSVVLAADLTPAQAAGLDPARVAAVVLAGGSPSGHASILVRASGIPMLVGAGAEVLTIADGTPVAVDTAARRVIPDPDAATVADLTARLAAEADRHATRLAGAGEPASTVDGTVVGVAANVGSVADAVRAAAAGAEGSGLVRTEFCFADREQAPSVADQQAIYADIAAALHPHRVVLRTLDVGGDKPLAFLPMPAEANPFLGIRGLRLSLLRPELLRDQLTAMLTVARRHPVSVMFPMVTTLAEIRAAQQLVDEVAAGLGGRPTGLRVGMMLEVPAAAIKAAAFAREVDFFSIGTNDLTQYAMAAERGNPALASLSDGLDPGVLGLIGAVCRAAAGHAEVTVCGELAADPDAVAVLLGLGVRELSVSPPAVARVKEDIRAIRLSTAIELAARALECEGADEVRALVHGMVPA
jgi:phosphoenolpyruvate-protein phosphotransferase/dihydroxyacetone kinase phosphotransfer subunit